MSFDIFDTLVHRRVAAPVDVFNAVSNKLCDQDIALTHPELISSFAQLRRIAESKARETRRLQFGGEAEITLDEIYHELASATGADKTITELLKVTELEIESHFLYKSQSGWELYHAAKSANKRILFISDMYLPPDFICRTMQNLGYKLCDADCLFVSGYLRISKHSGALFEHVAAKLALDRKSWIHIGDNTRADVSIPRKLGFASFHADWARVINKPREGAYHINDAFVASILESINQPHHNVLLTPRSAVWTEGYRVFGPLVFGFYLWLIERISDFGADKILFFARDSQLIMKIHQLAQEMTGDRRFAIPHEYVYVSRKSLYQTGASDVRLERIWYYIGGQSKRTIGSVLEMLGVDTIDSHGVLQETGLDLNTIITNSNRNKVHGVVSKLSRALLHAGKAAREQFSDYFREMSANSKRVAIVDIGWAGNMQAAFLNTIGKQRASIDYHGFYLGVFDHAKFNIGPHQAMSGWLVDMGKLGEKQRLLLRGGVELLEFALSADHGSTLGYKQNHDGSIYPIIESKGNDEILYELQALELQEGILAFAQDHIPLMKQFPLESMQSELWHSRFFSLIDRPTDGQVRMFADLTHSDAAGNNESRSPIARKLRMIDCILKTSKYRKGLETCFWKGGFRKLNSRSSMLVRLMRG